MARPSALAGLAFVSLVTGLAAPAAAKHAPTKVPPAVSDEGERADGDWIFGERQHHRRPQALSICGSLFTDRLGGGLWYHVALAHDGLLPRTNDSIGLELGADFMTNQNFYWRGLWLGIGPRWDWYLTRSWQVFATLKLGLVATLSTPAWLAPVGFFQGGLSLGGEYRLNEALRLRLEGGAPFGVRVGLSVVF